MAINQFSHNSNEPLEVRDLNVSGTETIQNIRIGVASISSLSGTAVTYSTGNFGVLNANTINANGDLNIIGRLYDKTNRTGNSGEILVSTGSGVTWSTANSITIDDDNLTSTNVFPTFVTVSSGVQTNVKVSSKRFVFNPLQGRVGIGTNAPSDSFQVGIGFTVSDDGTVKALKYFGDGSNLTGLVPNTLAISSATTPQFIGFSTTSSGVNTSFFASPTLVFTPGNSGVGSLGIGTTAPRNTLDVQGDVRITGALLDRTGSTGNTKFLRSTGTGIEWSDSTANVGVATTSSTATQFLTFVLGTGNTSILGIGTAGSLSFNPANRTLGVSSISIGQLIRDAAGTWQPTDGFALKYIAANNRVEWGPVVSSVPVSGAAGVSGQVQFNNAGGFAGASNFNYDVTTGNVGIGTSTNLTQKLIVQGNVNVSGILTAKELSGDGSKITGINTGSAGGSPGQVQFNKSGLTSGAQYFHFDDSRISVGIGTSVPTGRLSIANTSTGNSVLLVNDNLSDGTLFRVNDNSGSTLFDVDAGGTIIMPTSGNVGIGSTLLTPTSKLHVIGDAIITGILTARVSGSVTGAAGTTGQVQVNVGGAFTGAKYFHYDDARISVGIGTSVPTGRLSIASTSTGNSLLLVNDNLSDGTLFRVNDNSGSTLFDVDAGGTIVMSTTGNVGIGTTVLSPTSKLHVGGDVLVTGILTARMNEANIINNAIVSGNVGIATTNPTSKLHVIGDAIITGILTARVAGTITGAAGTTGQVQVNVGGAFTGAKYFHYDDARISVGIGTSVPTGRLSIASTSTGNSLLLVNDNISDGSLFRVADANANLVFDTDSTGTIIMPSTGNVGIGTTVLSPTSKLHVGGDVLVTGILTARMNEANIINNAIVSGNVGISSANPTSKLYVVGDAIITGILTAKVAGTVTGAAGTSGQVQVNIGGTFTGAKYFHYDPSTVSVGIGTSVPAGRLSIANTSTGNSLLLVNDNISDGSLFRVADANANLVFDTDSTGTIIMPSTGNVGIGTTVLTPTSKLHVGGDVLVTGILTARMNEANVVNSVSIGTTANITGNAIVTGNVGIATTNPTSKLHVIGDAIITGILTARVAGTVTGAAGTSGQVQVNIGGTFTGAKYFHYDDARISVGIGTSVPAGRLSIANTSTGNSLLLVNDNISDGSLFRVANSAGRILFDVDSGGSIIAPAANRFGIGTFYPEHSLQVGSGKTAFVVSGVGSVGIGTDNPIYPLTVATNTFPSPGLSDVIADFTTSTNSYSQINTRNASNGANASSDIIATADTGTNTTKYIDLGINNSGYSVAGWTINGPLDGYLYTSDTDLSIGAAQVNRYVSLFAGGTLAANEKLRANTTGVGIGTTNPQAALQVGTAFTVTSTGIVSALTYHGDGSNLKNITGAAGVANASVITSTATTPQFIGFSSVSSGLNTSLFVSTNLVYVPSGIGSLGIGTTNPTTTVSIGGTLSFIGNNIKIGDNTTGKSITSGKHNFFAGVGAGCSNTTGTYNNFFGLCAGFSNNANNNNFFGFLSGCSNTTGSGNNFFGNSTGIANTTGSDNNFFGQSSGRGNTTGSGNNFFGNYSGRFNTTGNYNIFFSCNAGRNNTTGSYNTFFGRDSGCCNSTASNNTFIGSGAGRGVSGAFITGSNNIGIGTSAGTALTTGNNNVFLGACSGLNNTTGCHNNFFGCYSGRANTIGRYNNFFGFLAGPANSSGINNNYFGAASGRFATSSNNNFFGFCAGANATGSYNTIFGFLSGCNLTSGAHNFFVGCGAARGTGAVINTGCNNIAIGSSSGLLLTSGSNNTFLGCYSGCNNTTASNNTFIGFGAGKGAGGAAITGSNNIGIGTSAGANLTSGNYNNFFGFCAGLRNTTGSCNNFFGASAGCSNISGCWNNFFGFSAGVQNTSGTGNNFFGNLAGERNSIGCNNNFFSTSAGRYNTSGNNNNFFGFQAGRYTTTGSSNTFIGFDAGRGLNNGTFNTGSNNIGIGTSAGARLTTGTNNVFLGPLAGVNNTTGFNNNFIGRYTGCGNISGIHNNFMGASAGASNNAGGYNNFFGAFAGQSNTGSCNNFIGCLAGQVNTGCGNNFFGTQAGRNNTSGRYNNFFGFNAGCNNTTASSNTFIGFSAGRGVSGAITGSNNIGIGTSAGSNLTSGVDNTFIGRYSGCSNTTGTSNVAIGVSAGRNNFNGNFNNFIGDGAGRYNTSGCHNNFFGSMAGGGASGGSNNSGSYNNFFGACAGLCNNSGIYNNLFGKGAGRCNTSGSSNTYFGSCAGFCNSINTNNTMIGQCAGFSNNGSGNFFVGLQAGRDNNTGSNNVYFGSQAGQSNTSGSNNFIVGQFSGFSATAGSDNTFFGFSSGRNNTGSHNTFIGCNAGNCNTSGNNNTFIGADSGCGGAGGITGSHNIGIGTQTGRSLTSGNHNTFLGRYAGRNTTGSFNNFVGAYAGCNATSGSCNIFGGFGAGRGIINPVTGSSNIAIGSSAGANLQSGTYNTFFGRLAGCTNTLGSCNVIIGCNAQGSSATVSNEVTISNGTNFARFQGAASAWTFTSDQRDKTNIQDLTIGRDFLRNIKPRKFEWNHRNADNDRGKEASGFIAQEVLEIVKQFNVPYTNLVDTNDENQYTLGTTNLIPIMVNAIKELDFENRELKNRILEIERRVGISSGS